MLEKPLNSVTRFVSLIAEQESIKLTKKQALFLSMLLTGMVLQGSFKVTRIATLFMLKFSAAAMYGMFRRARIPFDRLFWGCLKLIIQLFNVRKLVIAIDDTERERSKGCRILPFVRKAICKSTGGWVQAQNLVFLALVTDRVTIPIWFSFHRPARLTKEQKKRCKKNPKKIYEFDPKYRTKIDLACIGLFIVARLIKKIEHELGITLQVKCVTGDNGFAAAKLQQAVARYFGCQYVSKAKPNQNVTVRGQVFSLSDYFAKFKPIACNLMLRGKCIPIEYKAARVFVNSYGRKLLVVAIRYKTDQDWQYLFGTDLTWTAISIIKAYSLRWLVEVFFEDWKQYDGWGVGALQRSVEGAVRGVFLSLLADLFLLYHQRTEKSLQEHGRHELYSAGTVIRQLHTEAVHQAIEGVLAHDNPRQRLAEIQEIMLQVAERRVSLKHAKNWDFDSLEPSPSLTSRWGRWNRVEEENQRIKMAG